MIQLHLPVPDVARVDHTKIQSCTNDLALLTMTNASDWQYSIEEDELIFTHDRSGFAYAFTISTFSPDAQREPLPSCEPDVRVANIGRVYLFHAVTTAAEEWFRANLDAPRFGNAVVVEHRYARDLYQAMQDNGLEVERSANTE